MNNDKYKQYLDLFGSDLNGLEKDLDKLEEYSEKIDEQIQTLSNTLISKGSQHYLIEHLKNAVATQGQKLSIRDKIFAIKKAALDYSIKEANLETSDSSLGLQDAIDTLIKQAMDSEKSSKPSEATNVNIDDDIEAAIRLMEENEND